jgi:transcriptional regulator with XRE-family HTH domain
MYPSITDTKLTLGQLLAHLRQIHQPDQKALAGAMQTSYTTYLKTERGKRELSFLMALRICHFYKLDLHEFISMLSDEELGRNDYSVIKAKQQRERKKAQASTAKVVDIKTQLVVPNAGL